LSYHYELSFVTNTGLLMEAAEAPEEKVEGLLTACRIEPCVENIRF